MAVTRKPQPPENSVMDQPRLDEDSKKLFRENNEAIAAYLTEAFAENELTKVLPALRRVLRAQNVQAVAREGGLRRDKLYRTFGGDVDPTLGRILKLFNALNVRFTVVSSARRDRRPRPKLGRPKKTSLSQTGSE
jgi:probable addiction module antidote protein